MKPDFDDFDGPIYYELIEKISGDIVINIDQRGFIINISSNAAKLGFASHADLLPAHITDFADRGYVNFLRRHIDAALNGRAQKGWTKFPVNGCNAGEDDGQSHPREWYALTLARVADERGAAQGAICLLRSAQHLRDLEDALAYRQVTDPHTGLTRRNTFRSRISGHLFQSDQTTIAVVGADCMTALRLSYGQAFLDEMSAALARYLKAMAPADFELGLLDEGRFGILMPSLDIHEGKAWAQDVVDTFHDLVKPASKRVPRLSVSAGLARLAYDVDWSLREAELGLVLAHAGGGGRVATAAYRCAA
ncbi:MAG: GGDEF domain-containing protein [Erythrobacter sp.]|nr:GGDEF domain-containing protein [Erythrobacter sp.]NCQ22719.1 GGDEF domain-containing protein [Sphingomonadales bacterium]